MHVYVSVYSHIKTFYSSMSLPCMSHHDAAVSPIGLVMLVTSVCVKGRVDTVKMEVPVSLTQATLLSLAVFVHPISQEIAAS